MRRILVIGGIALAVFLAALGAAALYIQLAGIPRYEVETIDLRIEVTPEKLARGAKLASFLCVGCHADPTTGRLTGHRLVDIPAKFGTVYSSNITQHPTMGIGGWTDGELAYLLRTGVARDGRYLPPWMIKLPHMSDDDLTAIIAFLRSDDPGVAADDVAPPGTSTPSFLTKLLCHVAFEKLPYPRQRIDAPPITDRVAHGRYLVTALDCYGCHSASFETMDIAVPERSAGYLGGGNVLLDLRGRPIHSANLTFDEETGIGTWSQADLARALRQGFRPDGAPIRAPMAPMPEFTDDEIAALWAYLGSVPRIHNEVPRSSDEELVAADTSQGKRLYYRYACVSCHGEHGYEGQADLRQAAEHFATRAELEAWIHNAPAIKPNTRMPAWEGVIADEDYAPLVAYVLELGET